MSSNAVSSGAIGAPQETLKTDDTSREDAMDALPNSHPPAGPDTAADRYRRALETAAWSRAEFAHPVHARARGFNAVPTHRFSPPTAEVPARRSHRAALAVNYLAMWASLALVALGGYLR